MGKVEAWECEDTKKLFRTVEEYRAHRRKVNAAKRREAALAAQKRADQETIGEIFKLTKMDDIGPLVVKHWDAIVRLSGRKTSFWQRGRLLALNLRKMSYGILSNSHSAPIGKPRNWGGHDDDAPTGYPGFDGRIDLCLTDSIDANILETVGICTGTGGGGGRCKVTEGCRYHLSYDVKIWSHDYRDLHRTLRQPLIVKAITLASAGHQGTISRNFSDFCKTLDELVKWKTDFDEKPLTPFDHLLDIEDRQEAEIARARHMFKGHYEALVYRRFRQRDQRSLPRAIPLGMYNNSFLFKSMDDPLMYLLRGDLTTEDRIIEI